MPLFYVTDSNNIQYTVRAPNGEFAYRRVCDIDALVEESERLEIVEVKLLRPDEICAIHLDGCETIILKAAQWDSIYEDCKEKGDDAVEGVILIGQDFY